MTEYYVLSGHEIEPVDTLEEWAKRFELQSRHVALTEIGDVRISTVFLGINHNWGDGPPLVFETMIFGGAHDQEQRRYSTWDEAEAGHAELVGMARAGLQ